MFGIGPMEIAVILVVALLFVGPQKLPELAKQLGKFFVHAKRMTGDVRSTIDGYMKEAESEIIADEREKLKKLIEAEISDSPANDGHDNNDEHHDEDDNHQVAHHERDEYFEHSETDEESGKVWEEDKQS